MIRRYLSRVRKWRTSAKGGTDETIERLEGGGSEDAKREEETSFKCPVTTTRTNALAPGSLTLFVAAVHCTDTFLRASHFVFIASAAGIFISAFVEFLAKQAERPPVRPAFTDK